MIYNKSVNNFLVLIVFIRKIKLFSLFIFIIKKFFFNIFIILKYNLILIKKKFNYNSIKYYYI